LKKKINQGKDKIQKKIAIKIIGTKYDKWKKLKEDEIDKKKISWIISNKKNNNQKNREQN
jgi:hypothetical protein